MAENKNPEVAKRQEMMNQLSEIHDIERETEKVKKANEKKSKTNSNEYMNSVEATEEKEYVPVTDVPASEKVVPPLEESKSEEEDDDFFGDDLESAITESVKHANDVPEGKVHDELPELVSKEESTTKTVKTEKKKTSPKKDKKVDIITPEEANKIKNKKEGTNKDGVKSSIENFDDLDEKVEISHREAYENSNHYQDEVAKDLTTEEINKTFDDIYSDDSTIETPKTDMKVEVVSSEEQSEKKQKKTKKKEKTIHYYGGDGEVTAFKTKVSKNAKILRNIEVKDTSEISSVGIGAKTAQERQDVYLKTVLPTLQPSIIAVPMIISGVVISMSAFSWPDIKEICLIEEKLEDLDPSDPDYIYNKNRNFIEKRRKQLQLFYKHITAVSGYENKPSFDDLFNKILKFPDFQQLFFAAYATTSQSKAHQFNISCGACGADNYVYVKPKDLCFLLNTNINIDKLTYYIEKGSSLDTSESAKIYNEFQKEKLVEMANTTYRTKKALPNSAFIYDLKIPTIGNALKAMEDLIEVFRDKDLSYTEEYSGSTVFIDSSFGLPPELIELRYYLYLDKLIVAQVVEENKETNSAKVSYVNFDEKAAIFNSVYNLSPEDYKTLVTDENLRKLVRVAGIRHAIKGGVCSEVTCRSDLGNVSVEPETLFFMIAQQELVY